MCTGHTGEFANDGIVIRASSFKVDLRYLTKLFSDLDLLP